MNKTQIKTLQAHVGTIPDGFWGPKSIAACKRHLRRLMPDPNPWPSPSTSAMKRFYGQPGDEGNIVAVDAPAWLRLYDSNRRVKTIRCHKKVADSLLRAIESAYLVAPEAVSAYFGCFVNRNMRGGSSPSKHAWGAAIDFDANSNGNKTAWPARAQMPIDVMEAFAREGWTAAGAFWGRDAMHMQATRP